MLTPIGFLSVYKADSSRYLSHTVGDEAGHVFVGQVSGGYLHQ